MEQGTALSCDANGNVLLAGTTGSAASIATTGAFKTTNSGGTDAFIVKFNSAGVRQWATYYGGTDVEQPQGVACDDSNNVYITGYTLSATNIATTAGHQTTIGSSGLEDGFLVKFDSTGSRLWGTYYGGTGVDVISSVKCDVGGNPCIVGTALSTAAISTTGSFQPTFAGGAVGDAFLVRFSKTGTRIWGTYFGGSGNEQGQALPVMHLDIYI